MDRNTTPAGAGARSTTTGSASTTVDVNGGTPNAEGGEGSAPTMQQFTQLFESLKKQADGQSAVINRLQKELKELRGAGGREAEVDGDEVEAGDKRDGKPPRTAKQILDQMRHRQVQELREFKKQIEDERASMVQESLVQSLMFNLAVKGVDPKLAQLTAEALKVRLGSRAAVEKDSLGRSTLVLKGLEEGDESVAVDKWFEDFIKGEEGKAILPRESNPSLRGLPGRRGASTEGKIRITKEDMKAGRFNMEDMAAGKIIVQE